MHSSFEPGKAVPVQISELEEYRAELLSQLDRDCQVRFSIDLTRCDPKDFLKQFVSLFSIPAFTNREGEPIIADIKPVPGKDPHSFQGAKEFDFHTDLSWLPERELPRYATLLCLEPDSTGGTSNFITIDEVLRHLSNDEINLLKSQTFEWRSHFDASTYSTNLAPILTVNGDHVFVRFRRDLMLQNEDLPEAVNKFYRVAMEHSHSFVLGKGDVWVVDNKRSLHGRTALSGMDSKRHLIRIHSHEL